jgi:hypothetical protein
MRKTTTSQIVTTTKTTTVSTGFKTAEYQQRFGLSND